MPEPKPKFSAYGAPSCAHTMPGQERGLFLLASPFKPVPVMDEIKEKDKDFYDKWCNTQG